MKDFQERPILGTALALEPFGRIAECPGITSHPGKGLAMNFDRAGGELSRRSFVGAMLAVSAGCIGPPARAFVAGQNPSPKKHPARIKSDKTNEEAVQEVVDAHNATRLGEKLSKLEVNDKLKAAAERHAKDMATHNKMTHKGTDGSTPFKRIDDTDYLWKRAGENVAYGQSDSEEVMKAWMDSPPHKKNILGGFSQIGVAQEESEDGIPYWCVTFGLPRR